MDQRTWLWRKYSNRTKTLKALKEEAERGQELEKSLRHLSEKLTSLLTESDAKDNLLLKQEKVAEEALAGWEKAEANAASLKKELDEALQQTVAAEERLQDLDCSLKECMQQLCAVQEEREKMINDFAAKTLREEERARDLEGRLSEMKDTVAKLVADHDSLNAILETKENIIRNLNDEKLHEEENCRVISAKLDASEKHNASLKYEVYMLGKELQIRNEEKDFNLKSVKAAHKQHLGGVKRITELEEECNRLRVMLRKRLPGPAALAKMKNEVEMLNGNASGAPKKKSNLKKSGVWASADSIRRQSDKKDVLVERMHEMDEENKILKEELTKKNSDLQSSLLMCARTASKLSQAEKQLDELSKTSTCVTETSTPLSCDIHASNSENGCNDDVLSLAESWASALVTELEHFKKSKPVVPTCKSGVVDIRLMDDFLEMEKLASTASSNRHEESLEPTGKDPDSAFDISSLSDLNGETLSCHMSNESFSCQLKDTLRSILQKHHVEQENISAILVEIRGTLSDISCLANHDSTNSKNANPEIFSRSQNARLVSSKEVDRVSASSCEPTAQEFRTNLDKAISELIAVIDNIKQKSLIDHIDDKVILEKDDGTIPREKSAVHSTEFVTRVFRWKSLELKENLESFLEVCNGFLHGNVGLQTFVSAMTSTTNWIVDHSTPAQEAVSFDRKETYPGIETDKSSVPEEVKLTIEVPLFTLDSDTGKEKNITTDKRGGHGEQDDSVYRELQNKRFNTSQELVKTNQRTLSLQIELERLKELKALTGHHSSELLSCNGHSDCWIPVSTSDSREAVHGFPSLKEALEGRSNDPEDSKRTCADTQVQLGSVKTEEKSDVFIDQDQNQLKTNWEISVASEKLTECQETIQNIENQLKALAASGNSASLEKAKPFSAPAKISHRLGDQLLTDDTSKPTEQEPAEANKKVRADTQLMPRTSSTDKVGLLYGMKLSTAHSALNQAIANGGSQAMQAKSPMFVSAMNGVDKNKNAGVGNALAIVPRKQRPHVRFWRRVLLKKNKESGRKLIGV